MELVESVLNTEAKHSWNENGLGEWYLVLCPLLFLFSSLEFSPQEFDIEVGKGMEN